MSKPVILCVDDEGIILLSMEMQLQKAFAEKYLYETAENADEAIELIQELEAEGDDVIVIISDWLMPGMKGDELLIKLHEKSPKTIKIMLTGQADDEAIKRAKTEANLHRCLQKPWHADDLIEAIESGLAKLQQE